MNELQRMKRVLGAARAEFEPMPADRERVRRRLFAAAASGAAGSLAAGGAAGSTASGVAASGSLLVSSLKIFAGTLLVVGAGGAAVLGAGHEPASAAGSKLLASAGSASARSAAVLAPLNASLMNQEAVVAPIASAAPVSAGIGVPHSGSKAERVAGEPKSESRESSPVAGSASELVRELELLRQARQAIAEHRSPAALAVLDVLDRDFARGSLLEERAALRVVANCQVGDFGRELLVSGFATRFPGSVYLARLRRECRISAESGAKSGTLSHETAAAGSSKAFENE
jgi:hypothetical protein